MAGALSAQRETIDLAGQWLFALDRDGNMTPQTPLAETVTLPGTTDTNRKGDPLVKKDETTHLSRLFSYIGRAWYRREVTIPKQWKDKRVTLLLERTKPAEVYVDGRKAGTNDRISVAQVYDLTQWLKPGVHTLDIMVDNGESVPPQLLGSSHAYTEDTQTNWNGIIGRICLEAAPKSLSINDVIVTTDPEKNSVSAIISLQGNIRKKTCLRVNAVPQGWNGMIVSRDIWPAKTGYVSTADGAEVSVTVDLGADARHWSEFSREYYRLVVEVMDGDRVEKDFGLCRMEARDRHFYVNGVKTFLRGKHDACVFPLDAHVPMSRQAWLDYLGKCAEYGINHVRFHSWCPPEAAFEAADELGIYLQPELPFWGDFKADDTRLMTYLRAEGEAIFRAYSHHPSFVMFALGNELWGSIERMGEFVEAFRQMAPDKLFTFGSNYYLGYQGVKPGMDYFTTCRVGGEAWGSYDTHTCGSFSFADAFEGGVINHFHPSLDRTFEEGCIRSSVPVISHETAQFQTYPSYDEIKKYTGVLYPYNMEVFRQRLEKAGMADQAYDFHLASGAWSYELYKADVEMDLRTPDMAGFQLLDLQDYPGQGSAYVGMLDAMMDEKPMFDKEHQEGWKGFCSPVVSLLKAPKYCYAHDETIQAEVQIANYSGESLKNQVLEWTLEHTDGKRLDSGSITLTADSLGLIDAGVIEIPAARVLGDADAAEVTLKLKMGSISYNRYRLWIYRDDADIERLKQEIIVTRQISDDTAKRLEQGASVLLMPDSTLFAGNTVGSLFTTDYWNYRMFKTICEGNNKPVSPGTLGILTNPAHAVFRHFPTAMHTDWQWWPVIKNSTPLILDNLPATYRPMVQVIDNVERNHHLALLMEFAVGKGKLLICMSDLEAASQYVEGRAFYRSVLQYMHSPAFHPSAAYPLSTLLPLLQNKVTDLQLENLNNISPY